MSQTQDSPQARKPDALRDLYHEAVADDRGPSAASRAAILAHARQQAQELARKAREPAPQSAKPAAKPAANDRLWLRHALGGLAAVGVVGWLMMQHFSGWDGSDRGIGAGAAADHAVIAHADAPAQAPADASASAPAAVPADAVAEPAAPVAAEASAETAAVPADAVADAAPVTAAAPSRSAASVRPHLPVPPAPAAAPAPRAQQAEVAATDPGAEPTQPGHVAQAKMQHSAAANKAISAESAEASKEQAPLPLCPPEAQTQQAIEEARRKSAVQGADKVATCRPRKKPKAHELPAQDASEKGAGSER